MRLDHPYDYLSNGSWLRGNLHAHTIRSDGAFPVQDVIDKYRTRGYDFLMLSDHDIFTSNADYAEYDTGEMVMIPGNEITANGPHILHVGATSLIEPMEDRQKVFELMREIGGFGIINHPNSGHEFNHCPIGMLRSWHGYTGMEIFNGGNKSYPGTPYALDKWDMVLSAGVKVWGFANDDTHFAGDDGHGSNVVYARERTDSAIIDALFHGRFYASTGVAIEHIFVEGSTIRLETRNAARIVACGEYGRRLKTADAACMEMTVPEGTSYVRFECIGEKEAFAWTQPFFVIKDN